MVESPAGQTLPDQVPMPDGIFRKLLTDVDYSSNVLKSLGSSPRARAFSTRRMILPLRVFGSESTNMNTVRFGNGTHFVRDVLLAVLR